MKILITGCSGFIGKVVLSEAVKKYGKENICALSSCPVQEIQTMLHSGYNFKPDIFINSGLDDIDTIIHVGAFIPKEPKESNDIHKSNSNIYNTEKLLFANLPHLRKIIFASTIDVYAPPLGDIISEETHENPVSLYGLSKLFCENMIKAFADEKKIVFQILRIGHVFGPGEEKYKKFIPLAISSLLLHNKIKIFGDGQAVRTFIYIDDVVKAILNSVELSQPEGIINVVGDEGITINDLAKKLIGIHDDKNASIEYTSIAASNRHLVFNNTKLKEKLLDQFIPLTEGLQKEYLYMKKKIAK